MKYLSAAKAKLHSTIRRSRGLRASSDENLREEYGLFTLHDDRPESDVKIDIVAVHGFPCDFEQTWTDWEEGTLWLRDILPLHLPYQARTLSYGYDSCDTFTGGIRDPAIHIHVEASSLLAEIQRKRTTEAEQCRPIIFIAHSLGGILVKKAILLANELPNSYGNLLGSIKALVFMGVPHTRDVASLDAFAARLVRSVFECSGDDPKVEALQRSTYAWANISSQFLGRSDGVRMRSLRIRSFFETIPMPGEDHMILDTDSACLIPAGWKMREESAVRVSGTDHRTVCTIRDPRQPARYAMDRLVADIVDESWATTAELSDSKSFSMTREQLECFQSLYRFDYQSHRLYEAMSDSFFQDQDYSMWYDSLYDSVLRVYADPGPNRTSLASSIVEDLSYKFSRRYSEDNLVCYFFFKDDNETQASAACALCSILHQLISQENKLITAVMSEYCSKGDEFLNDPYSLWSVLFNAVSISAHRRIVLVLDGLDECSAETRAPMLRSIKDNWVRNKEVTKRPTSGATLKLLVTSPRLHSVWDSSAMLWHFSVSQEDIAGTDTSL